MPLKEGLSDVSEISSGCGGAVCPPAALLARLLAGGGSRLILGYGFYFFCCFLFDGGVHTADADADTNRFPDRGADGQADEKDHRSHDDNCADNGCPHDSGGSRRHRHHSRRENHGGDLPPA